MAASDRKVGQLANQAAHRQFVTGVTHGEVARYGKGGDSRRMGLDRPARGVQVQRGLLLTTHRVAALNEDDRIVAQGFPQTTPVQGVGRVAQQQQADGAALSLDDGVGRQRGRQGDQAHLGRWVREDRLQRAANADRQVVFGGQRLGRVEDGVCFVVEKHGVRIRAAGVNTEQNGHFISLCSLRLCDD